MIISILYRTRVLSRSYCRARKKHRAHRVAAAHPVSGGTSRCVYRRRSTRVPLNSKVAEIKISCAGADCRQIVFYAAIVREDRGATKSIAAEWLRRVGPRDRRD